ncbi:MAG: hypothetical protein J6Y85_04920 [Alphaproteobacteria bacterium]|nr:hypothetical protein [Alphaproteobacteria bacterium]
MNSSVTVQQVASLIQGVESSSGENTAIGMSDEVVETLPSTGSNSGSSGGSAESSSSNKKSCKKQGSHNSIAWIQSKYKNCVNCGSQTGSNGEVVYYCQCGDGCKASKSSSSDGSSKNVTKSTTTTPVKR